MRITILASSFLNAKQFAELSGYQIRDCFYVRSVSECKHLTPGNTILLVCDTFYQSMRHDRNEILNCLTKNGFEL